MWRVCRGGEIRYRFSSGTFHTHWCSFVDRVWFGCTFCKATAEWVGWRRGSNPEVVLRHFTTRSGQRRTEAPEIKWWRVPVHSNFTFYCNILVCVYFPKILGSIRRNTWRFHLNFRFLSLLFELMIARHLFKTYNLVYIWFLISSLKRI